MVSLSVKKKKKKKGRDKNREYEDKDEGQDQEFLHEPAMVGWEFAEFFFSNAAFEKAGSFKVNAIN